VVDATNAPVQPPESGPVPAPERKPGFLSSTAGKILLAVIALFLLLAIAGVVVGIFAVGGISGWLKSGSVTVAPTSGAASTTTTTTTAVVAAVPIVEPPQKPLSASFTFRNVFAPSIKTPVPASAEATSGSSSTAGSTDSPDTLYLIDIVSTDGESQGVFVWNGVTYTEGAGGKIDSSPWKVLEVGTDSVLMLYGDTQVTLTLGQGISK
jgi:hypothetical protein